LDLLTTYLKERHLTLQGQESGFIARRRHVEALKQAEQVLRLGMNQMNKLSSADLIAEDLKEAHNHLAKITGQFTTEALLDGIFFKFLYREVICND